MKEWLNEAYKEFAAHGPENFSINRIAKQLNTSRSSFYHHFGDVDILIDELFSMHWNICMQFDKEGKERCKNLIPDLYQLLSEYPIPLQFSWQLFHHRHIPKCNFLFVKTFKTNTVHFILDLFADHMQLNIPKKDILNLYITLGEAWYSRINPSDFSEQTLRQHAENIMQDLSIFMESGLYATLK